MIEPLLSDEVATAMAEGRPVVALESTIISHGMPYPRNVEMALEVEQVVRDHGAVPATIAVLNGVAHVGLDAEALQLLASDPGVTKASVRDLPVLISQARHGATTVAATMARRQRAPPGRRAGRCPRQSAACWRASAAASGPGPSSRRPPRGAACPPARPPPGRTGSPACPSAPLCDA